MQHPVFCKLYVCLQDILQIVYAEMEVITFVHEKVIGKTMAAFTQKKHRVEGHVFF